MQGQRDLQTVSRLIMSELTPAVSAQHGAFFLAEHRRRDGARSDVRAAPDRELRLQEAQDGVEPLQARARRSSARRRSRSKPILITEAPEDYIKITSGLGEAKPRNIIVLPVLFEEQVLGVIELASFSPFSEVHLQFLDQLMETIGVVLSTIIANMRTEELLEQSQRLTQELQSQSEELQSQQEELKRSNAELEEQAKSLKASEELLQTQQEELQQTNEELQEKAALLARQNRDIEIKNREIELARGSLEEKAEQLALSSKYKSEFLANMSHELRTPLNSLLILSKLLSDNESGNLDQKQVEFAQTIHTAGADLLDLINDILDLSKVEAGKMDVRSAPASLEEIGDYVERSFRPVAEEASSPSRSSSPTAPRPRSRPTSSGCSRSSRTCSRTRSSSPRRARSRCESPRRRPSSSSRARSSPARTTVISFAVTDTGIGIPHDKLRLIFESFQQADGTTSRKYGGTGLGLSISREIARLLGGEIRVESTEGEGSTFTLYLPAQYRPRESVSDDPVEAEAQPSLPAPASGGNGDRRVGGRSSAPVRRAPSCRISSPTTAPTCWRATAWRSCSARIASLPAWRSRWLTGTASSACSPCAATRASRWSTSSCPTR